MKHKHLGFTLVELMVAVLMITILAAISVPVHRGYQGRSRDAVRMHTLTQVIKSIELWELEESGQFDYYYHTFETCVPIEGGNQGNGKGWGKCNNPGQGKGPKGCNCEEEQEVENPRLLADVLARDKIEVPREDDLDRYCYVYAYSLGNTYGGEDDYNIYIYGETQDMLWSPNHVLILDELYGQTPHEYAAANNYPLETCDDLQLLFTYNDVAQSFVIPAIPDLQ